MRSNDWYNKHRWRLKHGYAETDNYLIAELIDTQWSERFEHLMRNRLVMGALRYSRLLGSNEPNRTGLKWVESAIKRLNNYMISGNTENLVDAANLCLLEFEKGIHYKKHFLSIDDGDHVEVVQIM